MKDSTILNKNIVIKIFILFFWICIWQVMYMVVGKAVIIPSPYKTFIVLINLIKTEQFISIILTSIGRVLLGFIFSVILGVILGIFCGLNQLAFEFINPVITSIKSTPVMSFIIIALIWFKSSNVPIFICFLMCVPIIWTNVIHGINEVDDKLIKMAKLYKVKKIYMIKDIFIPSMKPYLFAGCITALGLGWKVTVAAEVLSTPKYSIGTHLYNAKVYLDTESLFAWTIVVIILSLFFEKILLKLIRKGSRYGYSNRKSI